MAKEIVFENGQISNFEGLMTLTLILNWVIMHTIMHHSSTSTYMPNFTEIEELFFSNAPPHTFSPELVSHILPN